MIKITSREATVDELGLVHTDNHIENITKTSGTDLHWACGPPEQLFVFFVK
jgi:hypothetical protein